MASFISLYERILSLIHTRLITQKQNIFVGKRSVVYYRSAVRCRGGVQIGNDCLIGRCKRGYHAGMPFYTTLLCDTDNASIVIGDNCRLNGVYIHAQDYIRIGNNCVMASGISIIDSNGHETRSLNRTKGRDLPKGITIGNNVWIGINAVILKGAVIGDNAIIAAGSIVRGEVPADTIYDSHSNASLKEIKY